MNVVAVVQARVTSVRLPRKVLLPLSGQPIVWHVARRAQLAGLRTIVAIPDNAQNDELASWLVEQNTIEWMRGPEDDVLDRYALAATYTGADAVIRLTADCPLVPVEEIQRVAALLRLGQIPYVSTIGHRTFPRGCDIEGFPVAGLYRAHREALGWYQREHVTPYIRAAADHPVTITAAVNSSALRWCVDTPDDYRWFQALEARGLVFAPPHPTVAAMLTFLEDHPDLVRLDAHPAH